MSALLEATGIVKSFGNVTVLNGVNLSVNEGEFTVVMGPSGSGKSTLLYAVSGLDLPDGGSVSLHGQELAALSADALADLRRTRMGFVFQQPTLLRDLSVLENIVLTSALDREGSASERLERAQQLMESTGIWQLRDRLPGQVSGGQLQRAGICRALMRDPLILFGDEPTGALNSAAAEEVLDLLVSLNHAGLTMLVVTHDPHVAARAQRVIFMSDGRVLDDWRVTDHAGVVGRMRELGI